VIQRVIQSFKNQAEACRPLGSPFTADLCDILAENLDHSTGVGTFCLDWTGDPGPSADSIPLRLCGGLHALVLSGTDEALADCYPPRHREAPRWSIIDAALRRHEGYLLDWMQSPPQTNEVSRAAVLWPAFMTIASEVDMPMNLLEVGASGGLNQMADRFGYMLGPVTCGQRDSILQLCPEWRGDAPVLSQPKILSRNACDLNPLDPLNSGDRLRLRAYIWPDQADRVARMNAALEIVRNNPVPVEKADAVAWLAGKLADLPDKVCTVVYSTIAWQYLPDRARAAGEAMIRQCGEALQSHGRQLAWLRFEADGNGPGGGIRLQMWPSGKEMQLGRADFHGRWVDWRGW
jgi:hypothetical protein